MHEMDDGELARRVAGARPGEAEQAESELARRLGPRIRLYGLRHLRNEAAAQDLVQDVLVTTLQALREGRVREPDRLGSFVLGTCRMVVGNQRRGERRRTRLLAEFGDDVAPSPAPGPGADAIAGRGRLVDCLRRLSARERAAVVLTFYAEAAPDEIARELETSPGNVRVVRHRALARLHDCLERAS